MLRTNIDKIKYWQIKWYIREWLKYMIIYIRMIQAGWNNWRKLSGILCDIRKSEKRRKIVYKAAARPAKDECGGNEGAMMDVWTHQAWSYTKHGDSRENESDRGEQEGTGKTAAIAWAYAQTRQRTCNEEDYEDGSGWTQKTRRDQEKVVQMHRGRPMREENRQIRGKTLTKN